MRRGNRPTPFTFIHSLLPVALFFVVPGCGLFDSGSKLTTLPSLAGAVGASTTSAGMLARENCPSCAVTASGAGGLALHSSAVTNNDTELGTSRPRREYDYATQFFQLAARADQYPCVLTALKTAGLVSFDGNYAYIKDPSSNPVRVKVTTSDDKIQSWEVASCTGTTHDRLITGEMNSTQVTFLFKYKTATRLARIDATGLLSADGSWNSKVLDLFDRDTVANKGFRINVTQSKSSIQITGTEVVATGPTFTYGSASKAKLYGTAYASSGTTAYGYGAGSSRYTTDASSYSTSHWTDTGSSNTTSDFASDIASGTVYTVTGYSTALAAAPLTTAETWDCALGTTFVDLTSGSVMTGTVATSVNACLTAP